MSLAAAALVTLGILSVTPRRRLIDQGNMEGTQARARASTRGHSFSADPFGLRDFRALGDPRLPLLPAPDLDGKEGVNGSSPLGLCKSPARQAFVVYAVNALRVMGTRRVLETFRAASARPRPGSSGSISTSVHDVGG
jgi:hypothetical protein